MKEINFTKMHALGNDFMVIDGVNQSIELSPEIIAKWSDRHRGIGFDQCLIIKPARSSQADFFYGIYNADGTEVGQCGNGARCAARFIHEQKLGLKKQMLLETCTTQLWVEIKDCSYQEICVKFNTPSFFSMEEPVGEQSYHGVDIGNPHAVIGVKDVQYVPVKEIGEIFNLHPYFPAGVNVGFMQRINQHHIKLRVFERGVGETQACGSGACAAAVCARKFYGLDSKITVDLPGGSLWVEWIDENAAILMTGNAERVFDGKIIL